MSTAELPELAADVIAAIEQVGGRLEQVFVEVGGHLGTADGIFEKLNGGLDNLSNDLSGTRIEGASAAFEDIATRLRGLADALPLEGALLGSIGASAARASTMLKQLIKHIHLITVIGRSSRIEAASLENDREDFLNFTREASDLASAVQSSIAACAKEQEQLAAAIEMAFGGQQEFERRYHAQLVSASEALVSTFSQIKQLQGRGVKAAKMGKASTSQIRGAVGMAIVAMQAGDSTRQRFEHICGGLGQLTNPDRAVRRSVGAFVCRLQAEQLRSIASNFAIDISKVNHSLIQLSADSISLVERSKFLLGAKNGEMASFLAVMKQKLAEASALISACGHAKVSVDTSIARLEQVLARFRITISALGETIVDITVIGMNSGLKASQLGARGRAFVEIANELKQAADRISGTANMLGPVLGDIGRFADELKQVRAAEKPLDVDEIEGSMAAAIKEIEGGNGRLVQLMDDLTSESTQFEGLMKGGISVMTTLRSKISLLPAIAAFLEEPSHNLDSVWPEDAPLVEELFEAMYRQYTMDIERNVHHDVCDRFGIAGKPSRAEMHARKSDAEEVLFF